MGGSTIFVNSDVAGVSGDARIVIPDARSGHTSYAVILIDPDPLETPPKPPERGTVLMQVESLNGNRQLSFSVVVD